MTVIITLYGACWRCGAKDTLLAPVQVGRYRLQECLMRRTCRPADGSYLGTRKAV